MSNDYLNTLIRHGSTDEKDARIVELESKLKRMEEHILILRSVQHNKVTLNNRLEFICKEFGIGSYERQ